MITSVIFSVPRAHAAECAVSFKNIAQTNWDKTIQDLKSYGIEVRDGGHAIPLQDVQSSLRWRSLVYRTRKEHGIDISEGNEGVGNAMGYAVQELESRTIRMLQKKGIVSRVLLEGRPGSRGTVEGAFSRDDLSVSLFTNAKQLNKVSAAATLEHELDHAKQIAESQRFVVDETKGTFRGNLFNFETKSEFGDSSYEVFQHASEVPAFLKTEEVIRKIKGDYQERMDALNLAMTAGDRNVQALRAGLAQVEQAGVGGKKAAYQIRRAGRERYELEFEFVFDGISKKIPSTFTLPVPRIDDKAPSREAMVEYLNVLIAEQERLYRLAERRYNKAYREMKADKTYVPKPEESSGGSGLEFK